MKTRYYLLAILTATLLNALLPHAANLVGTLLICLALIPMAARMEREEHERTYHHKD